MPRSVFPFLTAALFLGIATTASSQAILFQSGFEDVADFSPFYITPTGPDTDTRQELSGIDPFSGQFAHRAWITRANPPSTIWTNNNHRGYPTIQFHKTETGPVATPVCITLQVWADIDLRARPGEDQWLSLATLTDDASDRWKRTVLVNVVRDGRVILQHVPKQGQQAHVFQSSSLRFPFREWVDLQIELDLREPAHAKVWINGELVSHAHVDGMGTRLAQAHFGLYAAPSLTAGEVRNDDLRIVSGLCVAQ